jgi:hypothetical protein
MSTPPRPSQPPPQNPASAMLAALDGAQIPGGCDHCDAYQKVTAHAHGLPGIHMISVFHDDDCPWYLARQEASQ